ncbi:hypothetical protein DL93DRAFT_2089649 [Clavulina sp. PMI_390]|nr:hypothetical protein DL93DRAFT_2089649 [Clavulina sp. PMI_390]
MAHINLLPVEIFQAIFALCSLESPGHSPPYQIDSTRSRQHLAIPLAISSVCSHWRSIALSTSFLWSKVVVHIPDGALQPSERDMTTINWQLKRIGSFSIDMTIVSCSPAPVACSWGFFLRLFPQCHFINLTLHISHCSDIFPLCDPMPRLRTLSIDIIGPSLRSHPPILQESSCAPSLQEVRLNKSSSLMLESLSSSILKHLCIDTIDWEEFPALYKLLRSSAQSLISLSMPSAFEDDEELQYPASPLELPNLESLTVEDCELDLLVKTPSLRRLCCFRYRGVIDDSDLPSIRELSLPCPVLGFHTGRLWIPPSWTREVETLCLSHLNGIKITGLCTTLCGRQEVQLETDAKPDFMCFPQLKVLDFAMNRSWRHRPTEAQNILQDLAIILEHRPNLLLHIEQDLIDQAGERAFDVFAPFGSRVSVSLDD